MFNWSNSWATMQKYGKGCAVFFEYWDWFWQLSRRILSFSCKIFITLNIDFNNKFDQLK